MLKAVVFLYLQRVALLALLWLPLSVLASPLIDLATASQQTDLVPRMQMLLPPPGSASTPLNIIADNDWTSVQSDPQRLVAPRQHSKLLTPPNLMATR